MKYFSCVLLYLILQNYIFANTIEPAWNQINGKWETVKIDNKYYLTELKNRSHNWGYSELLNNNSLVLLNPLEKWERITFECEFLDVFLSNPSFTFIFGMKEQRILHGFKFEQLSNVRNQFSTLKIIKSEILDNTKSYKENNNYRITNINMINTIVHYSVKQKFEIRAEDNKYSLLMNNKLIISFPSHDVLNAGLIGFSCINVQPIIGEIKVYNKKNLVFNDDFTIDKIKRIIVRGTLKKK